MDSQKVSRKEEYGAEKQRTENLRTKNSKNGRFYPVVVIPDAEFSDIFSHCLVKAEIAEEKEEYDKCENCVKQAVIGRTKLSCKDKACEISEQICKRIHYEN